MKRFKKMQILLACGVAATTISGASAPVFADEITMEEDAATNGEELENKAGEVNSSEDIDDFSDQMTEDMTKDTDLVLEQDSVNLSLDVKGIDGQNTSASSVQDYEEKIKSKSLDLEKDSDLSEDVSLDGSSNDFSEIGGSDNFKLSDGGVSAEIIIPNKVIEYGEAIEIVLRNIEIDENTGVPFLLRYERKTGLELYSPDEPYVEQRFPEKREDGSYVLYKILRPGHYLIKGVEIDGKIIYDAEQEVTVNMPGIKFTVDKNEIEFGEEVEIKVKPINDSISFRGDGGFEIYLSINKDGKDFLGYSKDGKEILGYSSEERIFYSKEKDNYEAKFFLTSSEGIYELIGYLEPDLFYHELASKESIIVRPSEKSIVLNNIKYDKNDVTVGEVINVTIEPLAPLISSQIKGGYIIVEPIHGDGGKIIGINKNSEEKLIGRTIVDDYWKNGVYKAKAFYGYYVDEEGYPHFIYYEKFDTEFFFKVSGSREDPGERGGRNEPLSPSATSSQKGSETSFRTAKVARRTVRVADPVSNKVMTTEKKTNTTEKVSISEKRITHVTNAPETGEKKESWQMCTIFTATGVMGITVISMYLRKKTEETTTDK